MNNGRGFPVPEYGNQESWTPANGIQPNDVIGQNQGAWTAATLGGQFTQGGGESLDETPRRLIHVGIWQNKGPWTAAKLGGQLPQGGGESLGETPRRPIPVNIGQNKGPWTAATLGQQFPQGGSESLDDTPRRPIHVGIGQNKGPWTAATLGGYFPQRDEPPRRPIPVGIGQNQGPWTAAMLGGQFPQGGGESLDESLGETLRPIPVGIGQSKGPWAAATLGGQFPQGGGESLGETPRRPIPVGHGIIRGNESDSWMTTLGRSAPMVNGIVGHKDSWAMIHQENGNGIVQNSENRDQVISTNIYSQGTGNGSSSWTPVTPGKPIPQSSNVVTGSKPGNQVQKENWENLIEMYQDLLQKETLDINEVAQDHNQNSGNQNQDAVTAKRTSNPTPVPNSSPNLTLSNDFDQASPSRSYFLSEDRANWDSSLLAAIMKSKKSSTSSPSMNPPQKKSAHDLNETPVPKSSTQDGTNSVGPIHVGSMLEYQQSPMIGGYNSKQLPSDVFPVPYRPCYDLNSPPRSEVDAASSATAGPMPFAPITPDTQRKLTDSRWVSANNGHESQRTEDAEDHCNIGESTSSAVSTTQKELLVSEEGDIMGIDLNKTPNQKTPIRRKKHRPKVIREGKPKKTATPKEPKNTTPNGNPVKRKYVRKNHRGNGVEVSPNGKRKYVRKKSVDHSNDQQKVQVEEPTPPIVETPAKSCRKQLNFDLECVARDDSQTRFNQNINLNDSPRDIEQEKRIKNIIERSAMAKARYHSKVIPRDIEQLTRIYSIIERSEMAKARSNLNNNAQIIEQERRIKSIIERSMAKARINSNDNTRDIEQDRRNNSILERSAMRVAQNNMYAGVNSHQESSRTCTQDGTHELNGPSSPMAKAQDHALNVLARNLTMRNSVSGQGVWNGYNQVGQQTPNLEGRELNGQMVNSDDRRGIKRPSLDQINPRDLNAMNSLYMYQKLLLAGDNCVDRSNDLARILESQKRSKIQHDPPTQQPEENSRGEIGRLRAGDYGNISALQLLSSCTGRVNPSYQANERHSQPSMAAAQFFQRHPGTSGMQPITETSQIPAQGHAVNSVTALVSWNQPPATPPEDHSRSALVTYSATLVDRKRTGTPNSSSKRANKADKMMLQLRKSGSEVHEISFTKPKGGPRKPKGVVSVEDLTCMLEGLCIYDENNEDRNALVPFRGNNAIIPFVPIKKRKPRPKVDLDPETDRLWRLLMGKEGSEASETLDKDKEKWWEDERRVFRGRADSFIARMHLVQGDRRFSRWKGSVVDSVIGVFLTQNVSDHLSSSAFMSLAAKFAFKSASTNERCGQDGACVLVEEPIETVSPNDNVKSLENIGRRPVFDQSSNASCESSEHTRHNISLINLATEKHNRTSEVILSQDSLESSIIQTIDEIRSSSGSNSEAEDQTIGFETSKETSPANPMQAEKVSMFKELFSHTNRTTQLNDRSPYVHHLPKTPAQIPILSRVNMTMGLQNGGSTSRGLLREESMSSLPKSGMTEGYHRSNVTYQQNEMLKFRVPPQGSQYGFLSNYQENFPTGPHTENVQHLNGNNRPPAKAENNAQKQDSCSEDRVCAVDKQNCVEASSKEQNSPHELLNGPDKNTSKGRKGNAEEEKKKAFDWDSLRRDVFLNCEKRERSKDAADSLDYEALRRAHVNEISDAIRERGMNNMLADRIQDFLDRLVRDHGSIDLEWLRDVPPDKAKDYLLSIRGLGLKSVECVRLLTLHHLAFPVDTNVGRIAVRLGWVPLQPLPESLQLHLLEMYPVLESIQKYLWPRLCKLDQLTLYELHYQMITFGKVFCTKSKPNCNACPMRAECRHFASAFASARLALPGPEEKRMVASDAPNATHTTSPMINTSMRLPPAENNCNKDAQLLCEPIIEEPKTPEPETAELSINDIEDQYYDDDDDDEIPTIKLDMNEFTMNLQKMQDSLEIQGDMSKALVALNPESASIPTPKLKNVSRLRTEHQVYELPDSHPMLEGLYKREPDDPSPYLLAIWTPGETANSMQPPERGCQAQETGILCDRTTCFSCNCIKEANSQVVRGTILMPCRTAMRGSFPLNGTYFQVNEMFADHASSLKPIEVPRAWIWNLPRRMVYFGTSVSTIFKGLTTQEIQQCFWRGFVCVRGFDQKTRSPRPLMARLHFPASKLVKTNSSRE